MFRKTTKKKRTVIRTTSAHDSEEEEDQPSTDKPSVLEQVRAKKKARRVVRSYDNDEDAVDDNVDGSSTDKKLSKKKRKRTGMGFGGGVVLPKDNTNPDDATAEDESKEQRTYDLTSLSALQAEQAKYIAKLQQEEPEKLAGPLDGLGSSAPTSLEGLHDLNLKDMLPPADDYVPLHSTADQETPSGEDKDMTVLTGDEALKFEEQHSEKIDKGIFSEGTPSAEDLSWEAQIARRAGISGSAPDRGLVTPNGASSSPHNKKSLQKLRGQIQETLVQLQEQQGDLGRSLERREAELSQTQEELGRKQEQVQKTGAAVEFYQLLRQRLANWVGALRQLQDKVIPIQLALHELEAQVAGNDRRRDWELDMMTVLYQNDCLDQVLGREPDPSLFDPLNSVSTDEFGRDVKSQSTLRREQRARQRQRICQQRSDPMRGDESDAFLTDDEKETFRERHDALQKALRVAMEELDEEYTSLQNLIDVFAEWKNEYPDDYKQCYAALSLADLASVLVQAELCSLNDPWDESQGYNEGKWISVVNHAIKSGYLDDAGVDRILEKAVYPSVCDLLHRSGYNLVSKRQTQSLCTFCKHVRHIASPNSPVMTKLQNKIVSYINKYLDEMSIPIVGMKTSLPVENEELMEAVEGATCGQMYFLKKILVNIVVDWGPIIGDDDRFIKAILDFTGNKFLFLISSLQQHKDLVVPRFSESPGDVYRSVWESLAATGWLEESKWMLDVLPLKAAAASYDGTAVAES